MKIEDILFTKAEEIANTYAKNRELEVNAHIAQHGHTKLLFGRWLFVFCDMKGFKFKESSSI